MDEKKSGYITEKIGETYREWKPGDIVRITAPTGTGKSYFIIHTLLPYVRGQKGQKILYLVNRGILKTQLENELQNILYDLRGDIESRRRPNSDFIDIMTYQSIEKMIMKQGDAKSYYEQYSYIVYDECHYFYVDSNFNPCTDISYCFLREACKNKIQIFISATMDKMKELIEKYRCTYFAHPQWSLLYTEAEYKDYDADSDYSYIEVYTFSNITDLKEIIIASLQREKWLIFVDSINMGKSLQKEITTIDVEDNTVDTGSTVDENVEFKSDSDGNIDDKKLENLEKTNEIIAKEDVVFIDARYEKEMERK